jgi:benzoate/toluate 1,2-dioxygenase reductase subunit
MSYQIALTFEDGVTRFIECRDGETVADASYQSRINIPLDCRDGVCGTCKSFCESGRYELGEYVPDEAMTEEEEAEGYVLTCQMVPQSDCVVRIFSSSDLAKTGPSARHGKISALQRLSDTTLTFSVELEEGRTIGFLPGQYVNIAVPGTDQTRSYSFSSRPGRTQVSFLLRDTRTGALPTFLRGQAGVGRPIEFHGPLGTFYLRAIKRPVLFLDGGTGLAPFTAMLATIDPDSLQYPIHLIHGVTSDRDLVRVEELEEAAKRLPNFSQNDRFTDSDGFRRTSAAFHAFLIERTGNNALRDTYHRLAIQDYMAEALRPQLAASQQITQDHRPAGSGGCADRSAEHGCRGVRRRDRPCRASPGLRPHG